MIPGGMVGVAFDIHIGIKKDFENASSQKSYFIIYII